MYGYEQKRSTTGITFNLEGLTENELAIIVLAVKAQVASTEQRITEEIRDGQEVGDYIGQGMRDHEDYVMLCQMRAVLAVIEQMN